jgi:hypothetical protein
MRAVAQNPEDDGVASRRETDQHPPRDARTAHKAGPNGCVTGFRWEPWQGAPNLLMYVSPSERAGLWRTRRRALSGDDRNARPATTVSYGAPAAVPPAGDGGVALARTGADARQPPACGGLAAGGAHLPASEVARCQERRQWPAGRCPSHRVVNRGPPAASADGKGRAAPRELLGRGRSKTRPHAAQRKRCVTSGRR